MNLLLSNARPVLSWFLNMSKSSSLPLLTSNFSSSLHLLFAAVVVEDLEIEFFIIFVEENDLTAVAVLDDLVKAAEDDNASDSTYIILGNE